MTYEIEIQPGGRFGRLTVLFEVKDTRGQGQTVRCSCECGNETTVLFRKLRVGHVQSCGCLRSNSPAKRRHGGVGSRLYGIWRGMRARTSDPNHRSYENYGKRGIRMCPEWSDFDAFREWALANGYEPHLTIDRIDGNKGYQPDNCRWSDKLEQARNKRWDERANRFELTIDGVTRLAHEWLDDPIAAEGLAYGRLHARVKSGWDHKRALTEPLAEVAVTSQVPGLSQKTIAYRIRDLGWTPERAATTPVRDGMYDINGVEKSAKEWMNDPIAKVGSYRTLMRRLKAGWDFEQALTTSDGRSAK